MGTGVGFLITSGAASSICCQCFSPASAPFFSKQISFPPAYRKFHRGMRTKTRAAPTTSSYVFAFAFPMTLLLATIFTSWRIGDKLDQRFLEELEVNEAIGKASGDGKEDNEKEEEIAPPQPQVRTRNRPTRKA